MNKKPTIITISNFNEQEIDYIVQPDAIMTISYEFNDNMKIRKMEIHVDAQDNPKGIIEIRSKE